MTDTEIPHAIWEGSMAVMGITLKCFVLSDGRRMIDADDTARFFECIADGANVLDSDIDELVRFLRGAGIPEYPMEKK